MQYILDIDQFLMLQDEFSQNFQGINISQSLNFVEVVKISPIPLSISQLIVFEDFVFPRILTLSISQTIEFTQHAAKIKPLDIIDTLFLWQSISFPDYFNITQSLNLIQDLEIQASRGIRQTLFLNQSVIINIIKFENIIQNLDLEQFVTFYKIDCEFVGTGAIILTEPNTITLTYGTLILILPNPQVGDARGLESARINQRTRGGDLILFRDPQWPQTRTLRFGFTHLSEKQKSDLLHFLEMSLADTITITDYEGRIWQGVIRTPIANVIQEGQFNYQAEFEFEGDLI